MIRGRSPGPRGHFGRILAPSESELGPESGMESGPESRLEAGPELRLEAEPPLGLAEPPPRVDVSVGWREEGGRPMRHQWGWRIGRCRRVSGLKGRARFGPPPSRNLPGPLEQEQSMKRKCRRTGGFIGTVGWRNTLDLNGPARPRFDLLPSVPGRQNAAKIERFVSQSSRRLPRVRRHRDRDETMIAPPR